MNDILDFSKIEAGKLDLECVPFELVNLVGRPHQPVAGPRGRKGASRLLTYVDTALPERLCGDPARLGQVLLNLFGQRHQSSPAVGSVVLRVTREETPPFGKSGPQVRFSVQDSGIGLSDTAKKKLFQPFTQADGSTARRFGGNGPWACPFPSDWWNSWAARSAVDQHRGDRGGDLLGAGLPLLVSDDACDPG